MKNFYLWIVALMVCVGILPAAAQEAENAKIKFSVNINHAEGVTCSYYTSEGNVYIELKDGVNEFEITNGTGLQFAAKLPWKIKNVVNKAGTAPSGYYGNDWYLYVNPEVADEEFTMDVININDLRTSQFTLNVDDPSLVRAVLIGYYQELELTAGENIIKYDPAVETYLNLNPVNYGVPFYSVKKNGVELAGNDSNYQIELEEDCVIDVTAILPDEDRTVTFSYSEEGEESISVSINNQPVTDFDGKKLVVKLGDRLTIESQSGYKIDAVKINGEAVSFYGSYSFSVIKDTEVYVDAHPYGKISATLVVSLPNLISITRNGEPLTLTAGENVIEFPENESNISWTVDAMAVVNSVTVNGNPLYSYQTYYTLQDKDVVVFDIAEKVFDKKFMVWIDNPAGPACAGYLEIYSQSDRSYSLTASDFEAGYNEVKFYQAMNPFNIGWYYSYYDAAPEFKGEVYLNGERLVSQWGPESTSFNATIDDGDIVKFFMEAAPVECNVTFDIAEGAEASVVKDILTAVENPAEGFDCFAGTQVVVSGEGLEVNVNGTAVEGVKDEDGAESFTFIVADAATTVAVAKAGSTGVASIAAEADSAVFNMQGVKVGTKADLRSLAPGLYIVAGKKVVVTE